MTGKEMLYGIQNLDADLIEEAEFDAIQETKSKFSRKKTYLLFLAAALIVGTMTAAAAYTRWSNTMQFGNYRDISISEEVKQQAEKSGLSVIPEKTADAEQAIISASDNGITVTLAQTVMTQHGGTVVFRIEGLKLEDGQAPWAWWDFTVDGEKPQMGWGTQFFNEVTAENTLNYQLRDCSIEFSIDFAFPEDEENMLGKEMAVTFTGFGIQGEKFEDEDIMTHPGTWELRWTLTGSQETPRTWTPNAKIGHWDVTLLTVEIGQYSMKATYQIGDAYDGYMDFMYSTGWSIGPAGLRLKDGTDITVFGSTGGGHWEPDQPNVYIDECSTLNTILDPSQIAGIYFYDGSKIDEQGWRVEKPYAYVALE